MDNLTVLKLDSSFKPVEVVSWQDAFVLTYVGKAWAVEYTDKLIHSSTKVFKIPSVIALFQFIDEKFFTIPCTRKNVLIRDDNMCQYCNIFFNEKELTLDHVIPRSKGGLTEWDNCVAACIECNQTKSDLLLVDAPVRIQKMPKKPTYRMIIKKRFKDHSISWEAYL